MTWHTWSVVRTHTPRRHRFGMRSEVARGVRGLSGAVRLPVLEISVTVLVLLVACLVLIACYILLWHGLGHHNTLVVLCQESITNSVSSSEHRFVDTTLRTYFSGRHKWSIAYAKVSGQSIDILNDPSIGIFPVEPVTLPAVFVNRLYCDLPASVRDILADDSKFKLDTLLSLMHNTRDRSVWRPARCCDFGSSLCRYTRHAPAADTSKSIWTYTGAGRSETVILAIVQHPGCAAHRRLAKRLWDLCPPEQQDVRSVWFYCSIAFAGGAGFAAVVAFLVA